MSQSATRVAWQIAFQNSPIFLSGGIAQFMQGLLLPIMAITEILNTPLGLLSGGNVGINNFFANFEPLDGTTLLDQAIGKYPFANQAIAANAVIQQPLQIAMKMVCPVRADFGYYERLAVITALQYALYSHNTSGGTYVIATPSFIYGNCLMKTMRQASSGESNQPQNTWVLDFEKPLLTLEQAQQAQGSLFNQITAGLNVGQNPGFSGAGPATGSSLPVATPTLLPSATSAPAAQAITVTPLPQPSL